MDVQICNQLVHQVNDSQTDFPVEFDASNFQNMLEDCLLDIILDKSLELMDLCSIGETCKRFNRIVQRAIIPKTLRFMETSSYYEVVLGKYWHGTRNVCDIKRILKIFGPCLTTVSVSGTSQLLSEDPLVFNVVEMCCGDELKSLTIKFIRISEELAKKLKPIFKKLQKLHLDQVHIDGDASLFAGLDSLVDLQVTWVANYEAILRNVFPRLERLIYRNYGMAVNYQHCWMILMQTIANCTELEELYISIARNTHLISSALLAPLQRLKSLRILELWQVSFDNFEVFAPMTKLTELALYYCDVPENLKNFERLAGLTKLGLHYWCHPKSLEKKRLVEIIRHLVKLEELELDDPRTQIDEKLFSEIVAVVNGRPKALTLISYFDFDLTKCDGAQAVRLLSVLSCEVF